MSSPTIPGHPDSSGLGQDPPGTGAGALRGTRVLDLSRVLAGPFAGQMLADHGAAVVKVESPAGDQTRTWGPPFLPDGGSAYFEGLNRSKSNICLDLKNEQARVVLLKLIAESDVVIENFRHGTMDAWGLGYESVLAERFPRLVYCRVSGFGSTGPMAELPGYDAVLQAFGGLMSVNGEPQRDALRVGVPIVDIVAANQAFSGILLALHEVSASGRGQLVDVSLLDAVVSLLHPHSATWLASGVTPVRMGAAHPVIAPYQLFATSNGPLFIAATDNRQFARVAEVLGRPELSADPRFAANSDRVANLKALQEEMGRLLADRDRDELARALLAAGIPASPLNDVGAALQSEQVRAREMVVRSGDYTGIGVPIKLGVSGSLAPRPPAGIGAHTEEVLGGAGYTGDEISRLRGAGAFGKADVR
ncbi:crotonobetainyl-CoA:carnitine CoA-transferase CaiB-like acyl-CoA transferase [Amycolatopsis sulphurea]|uniref:Crotonobetainyl-CoA:carnitine CoA-transferase CaiB-like acyl-CoA transferase n=1 Tax=Amycolatopsis sulphurea TaxID=76022 RepID=A0A2A9FIR0_9PSEU|nr:CoA transferase [Amycolatopsis sulphurea]PFG50646.1 crotonobetainyl-CoA:carnitine CoA-transferase CaiB-like acyl-CoA transferase [Amycolatopsis sulphurea]